MASSVPVRVLAAVAAAAAGVLAVLVLMPFAADQRDAAPLLHGSPASPPGLAFEPASAAPSVPATLVVDVQGAVVAPGVYELPAGSRVADAVGAAGGYGPLVDLESTARAINLAAPLTDGAQVYVPGLGDRQVVASAGDATREADTAAEPAAAGGLVALNSASAEELEALPGIGPVTADKIIAARQERPFATLEELVERKVMNNGQLAQIRELVSVP